MLYFVEYICVYMTHNARMICVADCTFWILYGGCVQKTVCDLQYTEAYVRKTVCGLQYTDAM